MRALVVAIALLAACKDPADDYVRKSRGTEAMLQLHMISRAVNVYYLTNQALPAGTSAMLPPGPCCAAADGKCAAAPRATWAADPIWRALDFSIDDPARYQYTFSTAADGQSFRVTAIGDALCDGHTETVTLKGHVANGAIMTEVVQGVGR